MAFQRAAHKRQLPEFRSRLEAAILGATCSLSERGLEIVLPRGFRKKDHLAFGQPYVFDQLIEYWGGEFFTHQR